MKTYGYARVSTKKQSLGRQIDNLKAAGAEIIFQESFTGTTMKRPEWNKLMRVIKEGDVIIFDEVSRMSRDASEGFKTYKELYDKGIELRFIKESMLNTECFKSTQVLATVGNDIADVYIEATNKVLMLLAEKQIQKAFETAEHEVDFLHKRVSEGVRRAQADGKQVGRAEGVIVETKIAKDTKALILKHSKDFGGSLEDPEVIKLAGCSRNSYYKYKRELREGQQA